MENYFVTARKFYSILKPSNCDKRDPRISGDYPSYRKYNTKFRVQDSLLQVHKCA
jgi:hypothetical protein